MSSVERPNRLLGYQHLLSGRWDDDLVIVGHHGWLVGRRAWSFGGGRLWLLMFRECVSRCAICCLDRSVSCHFMWAIANSLLGAGVRTCLLLRYKIKVPLMPPRSEGNVRSPAVAGRFYPAAPVECRAQAASFLRYNQIIAGE